MSRKRADLEAKGRLLAEQPLAEPPSVRTAPFRLSVDLDPALHTELLRWLADNGLEIGRRVPAAQLMRTLLRRLFSEADLQRAVVQDLSAIR